MTPSWRRIFSLSHWERARERGFFSHLLESLIACITSINCAEQLIEHILLRPAMEALKARVSVAEAGRQVTPRCSGPYNPKHRFEKAPIVPRPSGQDRLA